MKRSSSQHIVFWLFAECDKKKVCVRHDYRSGGHGYYKRKVKVCVKYDYKTSCYYKNGKPLMIVFKGFNT